MVRQHGFYGTVFIGQKQILKTHGNLKETYAEHTIKESTGKWNCLEIGITLSLCLVT